MRIGLLALLLSCAAPLAAQDISLVSPIDCDLDQTCFIQQYVDRDPGAGVSDHRCAGLSYDGHSGTDFALPSRAMMRNGVNVLAAATGIVRGVRDGMPDTGFSPDTAAAIKGRECGNGVRIEHEGGWVTQYCHLKQGSILVKSGDHVATGTALGLVGQSGRAAFPHVHLSIRKDGQEVDPFDPDGELACDIVEQNTLWADTPNYRAGGLIDIGFATAIPTYDAIKDGSAHSHDLLTSAPALVIWGYTFGTRKGDQLHLTLKGPDGTVADQKITYDKAQAQSFRAIGKKRRSRPWPAGTYIGTVTLIRNETPMETRTKMLDLR